MNFRIGRVFDTFLNWFLPQQCWVCKAMPSRCVCQTCIDQISFHPNQFFISDRWPTTTFTEYTDHTATMLYGLKYAKLRSIAEEIGRWMADKGIDSLLEGVDVIVPVPLHRARLRERQFNQVEWMYRYASTLNAIPIVSALARARYTSPLHELSAQQRQVELSRAFSVVNQKIHEIRDRHVLIVDDICTSGATFNEMACMLEPYVKSIRCVAFAHTLK